MNAPQILVVEDNPTLCDMIRRRLERRGYHVATASDGQAGLDRAHTLQPDLILLDMSLPVINGWNVASRLRAKPETRAIPIIAITAHAMRGHRERALEAGCDEFQTKPIDFDELQKKIERLLP